MQSMGSQNPKRWQRARHLPVCQHLLHFFRCSRWWRTSLVRRHFFAFFFSLGAVDDGEPLRLIVISLFFSQVSRWWRAGRLIVISLFFFWCRRRRQTKQVRRHLLHFSKKIIVKNKQITRKVDVHLLATDTLVFLEERFLQHHFSNVFCNIASASATLTSAAALQHCFCSTIFCNITFVVEWRWGLGFLMGEVGSWGLKCLGNRVDFFNG